jgi:hypothetical protein
MRCGGLRGLAGELVLDLAGFIGIETFGYTISDGLGGIDTQAIAVTVTNVNEAPTITSNGAGATATINRAENGATLVTTVVATDPDAGATRAFAIIGGLDSAGGPAGGLAARLLTKPPGEARPANPAGGPGGTGDHRRGSHAAGAMAHHHDAPLSRREGRARAGLAAKVLRSAGIRSGGRVGLPASDPMDSIPVNTPGSIFPQGRLAQR